MMVFAIFSHSTHAHARALNKKRRFLQESIPREEEKWPMHNRAPVIFHSLLCDSKRLVGQSLSALCTSSLQNVSAVGSLHSLSETMLLLSLTLFGLVSSEHNGTSLNSKSEAYRPQDTMHAFYSDNIYYKRKESCLSSVFFILGKIFSFWAVNSVLLWKIS